MNNLNNEFFEEFKKLESSIKKKNHNRPNDKNFIDNDILLSRNKEFWYNYKYYRNILAHECDKNHFTITEEGLNVFKNAVNKILNPLTAYQICIKDVFQVTENENISIVIEKMKKENFSNIPVIDNKKNVIGIFNSYTLFTFFLHNLHEIIIEPQNMTIKDFKQYYSLDINEDIKFEFISKSTSIEEMLDLIDRYKHKNQKIEAFLVTENGESSQKLLGIITSFDLLKHLNI